jgi:hypothetical protein
VVLGLARSSAYEAVRRGQIPSIRIGRRLLVPTSGIRRLLGLDKEVESLDPGGSPAALRQMRSRTQGDETGIECGRSGSNVSG